MSQAAEKAGWTAERVDGQLEEEFGLTGETLAVAREMRAEGV